MKTLMNGKMRRNRLRKCKVCGDEVIITNPKGKHRVFCDKCSGSYAQTKYYNDRKFTTSASSVENKETKNVELETECECCGLIFSYINKGVTPQYCEEHRNEYKRSLYTGYVDEAPEKPCECEKVFELSETKGISIFSAIENIYGVNDYTHQQQCFDKVYEWILNEYGNEYFEM